MNQGIVPKPCSSSLEKISQRVRRGDGALLRFFRFSGSTSEASTSHFVPEPSRLSVVEAIFSHMLWPCIRNLRSTPARSCFHLHLNAHASLYVRRLSTSVKNWPARPCDAAAVGAPNRPQSSVMTSCFSGSQHHHKEPSIHRP